MNKVVDVVNSRLTLYSPVGHYDLCVSVCFPLEFKVHTFLPPLETLDV